MKKPVLFLPILGLLFGLFTITSPIATRAATATFPINESFTQSTAPDWTITGDKAILTAGKVSGDAAGNGWLRLTTDDIGGQSGTAVYNNAFPSNQGVRAEFDYATYGADQSPGADGFSFYLIDGSVASPTVGAPGAGLGYGRETGTLAKPGVSKGYVGVGFDEFGNFASALAGDCKLLSCPGGNTDQHGALPQSITIRGSGDLDKGFNYLKSFTLSSPKKVDQITRDKARRVRITLTSAQLLTVEIKDSTETNFTPVISDYDLKKDPERGNTPLPATFKLGFSASNYNPANIHEIRNLLVTTAKLSTTTLTTSKTSFNYGQSVTFTATVTANTTSPGTVTFFDGAKALGTPVQVASGKATFTTSTLPAGAHTITAQYNGDVTFSSSSASKTVTVIGSATTTTLTTSLATDQSTVFSVSVTSTGGTPTGTVLLLEGTKTLATGTLDQTGKVTFSNVSLKSGQHTIFARYVGENQYTTSDSQSVQLTVTSITTKTSVDVTVTNGTANFTVSVTGSNGTPGGAISFYENDVKIGTQTLDANGKASFTTTFTSGSHSITAKYESSDTTKFANSTSTVTVTVSGSTKTTTTTTVTTKVTGQTATFTVGVSGSGGTAGGTITFLDGEKVIGTATLDASGKSTFTTSSLTGGSHTITVRYEGDANFASSTTTVTVTVTITTMTTITVTKSGQTVTFTAHVGSTGGTATGIVTFFDGSTQIGTGTLDGNGNATLTTSTLTSGTHEITVQYGGDATFSGSSSSLTLTLTGTTFTTISLTTTTSTSTSAVGQPIILVATVGGPSGTPTGIVTFFDGSTLLGPTRLDGAGRAVFTATSLGEGSHTITARYEGDGIFAGITSPPLNLTVNMPSATPADLSVTQSYEIAFVRDITFTIVARNNGANAADGATLADIPLPATLNNTGWTWTCTASNGATCSASGTGEINDTLTSFPSGGVVTYTLKGSLADWSRWTNTVRIIAPASISESDMSNNSVTIGRYQVLLPQMTRL